MAAVRASPRRSRCSSLVTAIRLSASAPCHREGRGENGRQSKTKPGRSRRRKGGAEGEGGGTAIRVLFVKGCFFLSWKFPPAVP